jgi:hypothetical protein
MHAFTLVWPFMCVHCLLCQLACRTQTAKPCCLMLANYGCNPIAVQPFSSTTAVRQHTGSLQHSAHIPCVALLLLPTCRLSLLPCRSQMLSCRSVQCRARASSSGRHSWQGQVQQGLQPLPRAQSAATVQQAGR